MSEAKGQSNMVKLFSLWEKKSQKGKRYWSTRVGNVYYTLLRNKSDHPQAPFFDVYVSQANDYRKGKDAGRSSNDSESFDDAPQTSAPDDNVSGNTGKDDENVPF